MIAHRQWQSAAEVVLCSGLPSQLALTGIAQLAGLQPVTPDGGLSLPFIAVVSLGDTVLLSGLVVWLLVRRGESPRAVLGGGRPVPREAGVGLVLVPPLLVFIAYSMWLLRTVIPELRNVPDNPLEALARSRDGALLLMAVAVVAGGLREELQRGFLLHRFRHDLGGAANGLVITSLAFGLGHALQGWDAVIVTALLGAFWGALYLLRGSIVAGVVSHGLFNAAQVVIAYLQRDL